MPPWCFEVTCWNLFYFIPIERIRVDIESFINARWLFSFWQNIYEVVKLLSAIYENIRRTNRYKSCVYLSSVESIDFHRLSTGQAVWLNRQVSVKIFILYLHRHEDNHVRKKYLNSGCEWFSDDLEKNVIIHANNRKPLFSDILCLSQKIPVNRI